MSQPQNNGHWVAVYSAEELVAFYDRASKELVWASHTSESPKSYPRYNLTSKRISFPTDQPAT